MSCLGRFWFPQTTLRRPLGPKSVLVRSVPMGLFLVGSPPDRNLFQLIYLVSFGQRKHICANTLVNLGGV